MQLSANPAVSRPSFVPVPPGAPAPKVDELRLIGVTMRFSSGQEICGEGERADHVYKVVRGAVREFRVLADGRRQISEFRLPGDVFGFEAGPEHRSSAEALTDTVLIVARRSVLTDGADGVLVRQLWRLAVGELQRSHDHVLTLGRRSANERVARFLVDLADRLGDRNDLQLPMSRQDIADYLGLTIETVSRTLTQFQTLGLIRLAGCRQVRIVRPAALAELCE